MLARAKILLVDDDPAVRASLAFSLEIQGFLIDTFDCGEDLADKADFPVFDAAVGTGRSISTSCNHSGRR